MAESWCKRLQDAVDPIFTRRFSSVLTSLADSSVDRWPDEAEKADVIVEALHLSSERRLRLRSFK